MLPTITSSGVFCTDASVPSQPVSASSAGHPMMVNRRLVLKQLPSGHFVLTVQSMEPGGVGGPVVIANSHAADASTSSITGGSSCEPDNSDNHVCRVVLL